MEKQHPLIENPEYTTELFLRASGLSNALVEFNMAKIGYREPNDDEPPLDPKERLALSLTDVEKAISAMRLALSTGPV
jgi:hypothetical protein